MSEQTTDEHNWIELTTLEDLPERIWICNHCSAQRREVADPSWLREKPAEDRRRYEALGIRIISHPLDQHRDVS